MEGSSWSWHAKDRKKRDPNDGSQIHKLKDTPPFDSIHLTSQGIQAIRSDPEIADSWRAPESAEYTSHGNLTGVGAANYGPYGKEHTRDDSDKVYDEDINAEAEEFIEEEHQKLQLRK